MVVVRGGAQWTRLRFLETAAPDRGSDACCSRCSYLLESTHDTEIPDFVVRLSQEHLELPGEVTDGADRHRYSE